MWPLSARWQNPYSGYKQLAVIVSSEAEQCRQEHCKLHVCDQHVTFLHEDYGWLMVKYHNGKQILVDGEKECRRTLLTCEIWKMSVSNYSSIRRGRCKDPRASEFMRRISKKTRKSFDSGCRHRKKRSVCTVCIP